MRFNQQRFRTISKSDNSRNKSISIVGTSGTGKSESYIPELLGEMRRKLILVSDPFGAMAKKILEELCGKYPYVMDIDLSRTDRVVPIVPLGVSTAADQATREDENKTSREQLVEIFAQAPDDGLSVGPQKGNYAKLALEIYQNIPWEIRQKIPLWTIPRIFNTWDNDWHNYICGSCADKELVSQFIRARVNRLHESTRLKEFAPAQRFMERFFWSLKHEWTNHDNFADLQAARLSVFKYIETFYNPVRTHQTLGYLSPDQYEAENAPALAA